MKVRRALAIVLSIAVITGNSINVSAAEIPIETPIETPEEITADVKPEDSNDSADHLDDSDGSDSTEGGDPVKSTTPEQTPDIDENSEENQDPSEDEETVSQPELPPEDGTESVSPEDTNEEAELASTEDETEDTTLLQEPAEEVYDADGNLYALTDETVIIDGEILPVYRCEFEPESGEEAHGEAADKAASFRSSSADRSSSKYYWAYYNQIDALARQFYNEIEDKYTNFSDPSYQLEISVDPTWEISECYANVASAIAAFNYDHPEAFWLYANAFQWGASYSGYDLDNDGTIDKITELTIIIRKRSSYSTMLTPIYNGDWSAVEADQVEMESCISEIISEANTKSNLYDKLAVVNDNITYLNYYNRYVAHGVSTSEDLSKAYISASALTQQEWLTSSSDYGDPQSPVCEGYSRSFKLICDRLGIPCILVVGNGHMWNYVQDTSDGIWYAVDCTWDDPLRNNEYSVKETPSSYIHQYLLVGSTSMDMYNETFISQHPANGSFWVGGEPFDVPVLSSNAYAQAEGTENIEGAWDYDETTHTLTLTDYTGSTTTEIDAGTVQLYVDGDLNLILNGQNTLSTDSDYGIWCSGNLTISGTGSLAVENVKTGIFAEGEVIINGGVLTVNASGSQSYGLSGRQATVNGGELYLYGETGALTVPGGISVSDGMVIAAGSSKDTAQGTQAYNGENYIKVAAGSIVRFVSGTDMEIASQIVFRDALIVEPAVRLKGYSLTGWYTSATEQNENTKWNFDINKAVSDITLYAGWQANQYTVTFDVNDGAGQNLSKTVTYDSAYGELPQPERTGYDFDGWYTAKEGGDLISKDSVVGIDEDHTLYAHWDMIVSYVTFKLEGGSFPETDSVVFTIPYNQSVQDSIVIPENPVRTKYEFAGWYTAADGGEEFDFGQIISGDVTVYAHWQAKYAVSAPTANITSGTEIEEEALISLKSSTLNARIYYTTDGSEPTVESDIYTDEISAKEVMNSGTVTIKAMAVKENYADSETATFTYPVKDENLNWGDLCEEDKGLYESPAEIPDAMWIAGVSDQHYTGTNITFSLRVYDHKTLLTEKTDYTVTYKNNKSANDASVASKAPTVIVTGKGNYSGKIEKTFKILPVDIAGEEFSAADLLLAYNKKVQKQVPVLLWNTTKLKNGTDYTVSYPDNMTDAYMAAGSYRVVVTGKGNYTGTITVTEEITEKTLVSKLSVASIAAQKYTGNKIEPVLTVKSGSKVLTGVKESGYQEGETEADYTYEYIDNVAVGTASVVITGRGDYIGTRTVSFKINGTELKSMKISGFVSSYAYADGAAIEQPDVKFYYVTGKGASAVTSYLQEDNGDGTGDYTVEYQNNILPGTATVIYTGINGYTGTVKKTYKITGISFSSVKINNFVSTYVYTGVPVEQNAVTLTLTTGKGTDAVTTELVEGQDYSVSYTKNESAGTATVVYTGLGVYTGTQKKTFKIQAYDLNKDENENIRVTYDTEVIYAKGGAKPVPSVYFMLSDGTEKKLTEGTDYTLGYKNNTAVNDGSNAKKLPTIVLKGKGNFTGTRQKEIFTIESQALSNLTLTASDKVYSNKKNNFPVTPVVTDLDGKALKAGTDYDSKNIQYFYEEDTDLANGITHFAGEEISSKDVIPAGTIIRVQVTGKGYYTGTVSGVYRIVTGDIGKATIKVNSQYFTGREVRPGKSQISVTLSGKLLSDQDYEIVGYTNNINKGTAKITLKGVGDYGGSKAVNFTIAVKSLYYIVSFNGNQATSGSMKTMQLAVDKEYTLTNNAYKRTNYVFTGWNTKEDGTGTHYDNKGIISNAKKQSGVTLVLYAQWEPIAYTITYHLAGGPNNALNTKTSYTADDRTFTIEAPEREKWPVGYQFGGWYTENTYKNKISIVKKGSGGDLNLYAKWIPYTYTVSFDGNGATSGSVGDETFSYGVSKAIAANKFKRTGYVFLGWAVSPDAADPEYTDKEMVSDLIVRRNNISGSLTLYAVWQDHFDIEYVVNEGTLDSSFENYTESYIYGKKCNLPTPVRDGYTFGGWYKDADFKTKVSSITGSMSGNLKLYAKWTAYNYAIVFNGNGQSSGSMSKMSMVYGTEKALNKNTFVKKGYKFAGWSTAKDGAVKYTEEEVVNILPSKKGESITLYAQWKPTNYSITYETNGGTLNKYYSNYIATYEYNHDGGYALPVPTKTGYTFAGWYKESTFKTKVASIAKTAYGDLTLYAKWTASYVVMYKSNADDAAGTMNSQVLNYGTSAALRKNAFKRPGYVFMGWAVKPDGEVVFTDAQKLQYPSEDYMQYLDGDWWAMTLYAVWDNQFTITYHANNGTDDTTDSYIYGTGKSAESFPTPVREGFTFAGWYKESSLKTKVTSVSKTNSDDMDLYAKWTGKNYKVTFAADAPDGKASTGKMGVETLTYGTDKALAKNAFKVTGYTFLGWSTKPFSEATDNEKADPALRVQFTNAEKITGLDTYRDFTLYAVWKQDVYSIVYNNMLGVENPNPDSYTVDDAVILKEPERMGDTFLGWYTDAACKKKATDIKAGTTGNKTYYAKWSQVNYTLNYVLNGGILDTSRVGYISSYGSNTDNGYLLPTATREGYIFEGWYKEATFKTKVETIIASPYVDMTLYAKWTPIPVVPVTSFSLNTAQISQYEGTTYQLEATEIQPEGATYSTIQWESSNPEVASVDAAGLVSLKQAGMAVITAYTDGQKFVQKCLVIVEKEEDSTVPEGSYVTPQEYRSVDDEDDTAAFNRAIQDFHGNYETLYVPPGTYLIDAETGIQLASKMNLIMSPDAVIKAVGNSSKFYDVILVKEVSQITISGGQIVGERYEHTGNTGEWGHGIGVYDCSVITITDVNISECWGDGIYLGTNRTDAGTNKEAGCGVIKIENCNLYDNRRNNMSVVCADYVTIDSCTFNNAGGTAPEYGIDIETNFDSNPCEHITISNSSFDGNGQGSIGIITAANDIEISNCTLNGAFINYAGTNVAISNTTINGEMNARIGVIMDDNSEINDGGSEEDELVAIFSAVDLNADKELYSVGEYGINASNEMKWSLVTEDDSPSGQAMRLERLSAGTQEAGYYLKLSELTDGGLSALEKNVTYRFEYVVKGTGQWGIKTNQTGWYPCVPMEDWFSTGIVTYKASAASSCQLMLYAVDKTSGMWLEVDSVKIYEVR